MRKSAKRARYAAESAEPVLGKPAVRMAKRMQKVQQVLGENQDSVAARLLIRHLVFQAHLAGENCFTFGLVYGMEMARASEARAAAEPAIRSALGGLPSSCAGAEIARRRVESGQRPVGSEP